MPAFIMIALTPTSQQNNTVKKNKNIFLNSTLNFLLVDTSSKVANLRKLQFLGLDYKFYLLSLHKDTIVLAPENVVQNKCAL